MFLIKYVESLSINQVLQDTTGRRYTYTRLHDFIGHIGRPPFSSSTGTSLKIQDPEPWVIRIKRGLTTVQLKKIFDTLNFLEVPFGKFSTLEFTARKLEWYYTGLVAAPSQTSKHDLIIAYYCFSWVLASIPNSRLIRKAEAILKKVRNGVVGYDIELVEYPNVGTEIAPYQSTYLNQFTSASIDSEMEYSARGGVILKRDEDISIVSSILIRKAGSTSDSIHDAPEPSSRAPEHAALGSPKQSQESSRSPPGRLKRRSFLGSLWNSKLDKE
ncbi:uncharacterized protein DFL_009005 [Arthrobotrys flagrans]|uniref:Uncharacterized protein n=1 Tax=Arthrobotrys flagrans TaxID=97331 RepID=A0A436ZQD1_ARTFL|nr:hypothetical protein DFL_009005 [Arthrobotrys flagrans]